MAGIGGRRRRQILFPNRFPNRCAAALLGIAERVFRRSRWETSWETGSHERVRPWRTSRRAPVNLTDLKVKSLKPDPAGEYVQGDAQVPGFGVRVRPHGTATYVVMKRLPGGGATRITLGRVPAIYPPAPGEITLAEARERGREAVAALRQGVDVTAQKRRRARARQAPARARQRGARGDRVRGRQLRRARDALHRAGMRAARPRRRGREHHPPQPAESLGRSAACRITPPRSDGVARSVVESGRSQAAHKLREVALRIVNWAIDRGELEIDFLGLAEPQPPQHRPLRRSRATGSSGRRNPRRLGGLRDRRHAVRRIGQVAAAARPTARGSRWHAVRRARPRSPPVGDRLRRATRPTSCISCRCRRSPSSSSGA